MSYIITEWRNFSFSWRAVLLAFFIGAVCGWLAAHSFFSGDGKDAGVGGKAVNVVQVGTSLEDKKEITYVAKEPGEKTDVEIKSAPPKVVVSVNGKETQFETLPSESQKFDKGKLVVTEETKLTLDIKTPPPPKLSIGLGWSNHGPAALLGGRLDSGGHANWWLYGDRKTVSGGIQVPIGK